MLVPQNRMHLNVSPEIWVLEYFSEERSLLIYRVIRMKTMNMHSKLYCVL